MYETWHKFGVHFFFIQSRLQFSFSYVKITMNKKKLYSNLKIIFYIDSLVLKKNKVNFFTLFLIFFCCCSSAHLYKIIIGTNKCCTVFSIIWKHCNSRRWCYVYLRCLQHKIPSKLFTCRGLKRLLFFNAFLTFTLQACFTHTELCCG